MRSGPLVALSLLFAGCVAPERGGLDDTLEIQGVASWRPGFDAVRAALDGVPCVAEVPASGASANVLVLASEALDDAGGTNHGELDVHGSIVAVARYGTGGFDLADVSAPLEPRQIASWDPDETDRSLDVKFTPDGATILVGGDDAIRLVDVRDRAAPRLESEHRLAKPQAHMLTVFDVAGAYHVAAAKAEGYDLEIFRIEGEPGSRTLVPVSRPRLTAVGEITGNDLLRSHDAWFGYDEGLRLPLLWVANVWEGVVALDVSDPAAPRVVLRIPNADPYQGYTHTVQSTILDGRRLVVAVNEVGANALKVWDATDVAKPRLVATWHVPIAANPQHNLQLVGARAYVAHYEEGVFVFDLRTVGDGPLPTRIAPVARLPAAPSSGTGAFVGTWDVALKDGVILTSEIESGLRVAGYGCLWPGDEEASSTG